MGGEDDGDNNGVSDKRRQTGGEDDGDDSGEDDVDVRLRRPCNFLVVFAIFLVCCGQF